LKWVISAFWGVIAVFAYPPFMFVPLIFVGYAGWLWLIFDAEEPAEGFIRGLAFGIGHYLAGSWWLFSIHDERLSPLLTGVFIILVMAIYPAGMGLLTVTLKQRFASRWLLVTLVPLLLLIFEWFKHHILSGFAWLDPSVSLSVLPIGNLYALAGSWGVDYLFFVITTVTTMVVFFRTRCALMLLLSGMVLIFFPWILTRKIHWTHPYGEPLSTVILQDNFGLDRRTDTAKTLERISEYVRMTLRYSDTQLSIWPESSVSVALQEIRRELLQRLRPLAQHKVTALFGAYLDLVSGERNAIVRSDTLETVYTKRHLIPFGEYIPSWLKPFHQFFPRFHMDRVMAGTGERTFVLRESIFAPTICYEILYGDEGRRAGRKANVLLHISDLGWFAGTWAAPYLLSVARIRTLEQQKPMLYSVNAGQAAYITAWGDIQRVSSVGGKASRLFRVQASKGATPFGAYGLVPVLMLIWIWGMFSGWVVIFAKGMR